MPYIEWGHLVSQLRPTRAAGAVADGRFGNWIYEMGAWSADLNAEYGNFDKGMFYTAGIGYDFSKAVSGLDSLEWHFNAIINDADADATAVKPYDQTYSS